MGLDEPLGRRRRVPARLDGPARTSSTDRYGLPDARALALIFGPTIGFLAATVLAHVGAGVPFTVITRDPLDTADAHPLTGIQSVVGVLVWSAAGGICLFAAEVARRQGAGAQMVGFLLLSGVLSLTFAIDDQFMVHDQLTELFTVWAERILYLGYVLVLMASLIVYRRIIRDSDWGLLLVAVGFLAASVVTDQLHGRWDPPYRIFLEDGFKLLGIVTWSAYLVRTCLRALTRTPAQPDGSA